MSYWDKEQFYPEEDLATTLMNEGEVLRKKDQIARGDARSKPTGPTDKTVYERGLGTLQARTEEARQAYLKLMLCVDDTEAIARETGTPVALGKMSEAIGEMRRAVAADNKRTFGDVPGINPKDAVGQKRAPLHLVPPALRIYVAQAMADGAAKYGPYNFRETAILASVYYSACARHMDAWWDGEENAEDSGVHHLGHAAACLALLIDAIECDMLKDDRPTKGNAAGLLKRIAEKSASSAADEAYCGCVTCVLIADEDQL